MRILGMEFWASPRFWTLSFFFLLPLIGLFATSGDESGSRVIEGGQSAIKLEELEQSPWLAFAKDGTTDGVIIVAKQTIPENSPQTFSFSGDLQGSLGDGEALIAVNVPPAFYTTTEDVPEGWELTSIECNDSDSVGFVSIATAVFNLQANEIILCTFFNEQVLTIFKDGFESGDTSAWSTSVEALSAAFAICQEGAAMEYGENACIDQICYADPYCCSWAWDSSCVSQAVSACGLTCR